MCFCFVLGAGKGLLALGLDRRGELGLEFLILSLQLFPLSLELFTKGHGFLIALLAFVVASLQFRESAFEQFEKAPDFLTFLFSPVAAPFNEGHQFPLGDFDTEFDS